MGNTKINNKPLFYVNDQIVKDLFLQGYFGLEKENLRIDRNGFLSHSPHPFKDNKYIVRDFCESQTEVNTPVMHSALEAVNELRKLNNQVQATILQSKELLWPFSNPPYIKDENDIMIAQFFNDEKDKTVYREYLSKRYGRYKMTFSGIHVNFSFGDDLLKRNFLLSNCSNFADYKNQVYLNLARKMVAYGWILVAISAASPILDSSFIEKGKFGNDIFYGLASIRCSEMGYWNYFTPVLDYSNINTYVNSIQEYVNDGWIKAASELYYPIRLKPPGANTLERLRTYGIDHIELRMFDLNPLIQEGVNIKDIKFAHLLMLWLISLPDIELNNKDQVNAIQNFKSAAHYDLKTVRIIEPNGDNYSIAHKAKDIINQMKLFYNNNSKETKDILDYEYQKFIDPETRYAWQIRKEFSNSFVEKGLQLSIKQQKEGIKDV